MRIGVTLGLIFMAMACSTSKNELKTGRWRGTIALQGKLLPFNFEITKDSSGYKGSLKNGKEKILLDEVSVSHDSIIMSMHIFDASLRARIGNGQLNGIYTKHFAKDYRLPFEAVWGDTSRFEKISSSAVVDFSGKYSVKFVHNKDTSASVGIFKQEGNHLEGTFLKPSGDYRYLEGEVRGDTLWLSTFDGAHLFIFRAVHKGETTITGDYWSGKSWHETWVGEKNDNASLPDLESLTYLKKGFEKLEFNFPDPDGQTVRSNEDRFKGKVVIVQILGTWCPNCMDETKFLSEWYPKNKDRGVEILGLAFENKDDFGYASARVKKMQQKLHVPYTLVIAGSNDKASLALPTLNKVVAFPTTIYVGKDGKVKRIHIGFSGPGTGSYYQEYIQHFNETIDELVSESISSKK